MEDIRGKRIGFAMTGSFCTIDLVLPWMQELVDLGADVIPIFSTHVGQMDTRFHPAQIVRQKVIAICGKEPIETIQQAEPIGPQKLLDMVLIAPCTGNTMAKLANAITDTPALMAAKSHLRNGRPVLLAIATNDGLSANARNLGQLLNAKHIYFVPFGQDGHAVKANSIQSHFARIPAAVAAALEERQLQPLLLGPGECLKETV